MLTRPLMSRLIRHYPFGWGASIQRIKKSIFLYILAVLCSLVMGIWWGYFHYYLEDRVAYILLSVFFIIAFLGNSIIVYKLVRTYNYWINRDEGQIESTAGEVVGWTSSTDLLRWTTETFVALRQDNNDIILFRIIGRAEAIQVRQLGIQLEITYTTDNGRVRDIRVLET